MMRIVLITLAICAIFFSPVLAKDPPLTVYVLDFGEANIATGSDGTKIEIPLNAEMIRVVKITGGMLQDEPGTSYDLKFFSDHIAATEQEDTLYSVENITSGFINDDTPVWFSPSGETKSIWFQVTNDGAESDYEFLLYYQPYFKETY